MSEFKAGKSVKIDEVTKMYSKIKSEKIRYFDFSETLEYDSSLLAFLQLNKTKDVEYRLNDRLEQDFKSFKDLIDYQVEEQVKITFIEKISNFIDGGLSSLFNFFVLASDSFYYGIRGVFTSEGRRKGSVYEQVELIGTNAVPIITLLSFLIGLILSLQSAAQLRQFGANIFLVDLIVISMITEMGPMITAIIVAGRSGSAIAAEIATMKITEEIDALRVMALNPLKYVVSPKIIGLAISLPLLTIAANLIGIAGGFIIAVLYLDLNAEVFIERALSVMTLKSWFTSIFKSFVFSLLIGFIGVYFGFNVKGGAEGVGKATTSSVVAAIFSVIVADALLSIVFYFKF
ncbi:MAG: ABC transporter permease [Candidatus Delongbacteria bacterium]|nr:ABC transporter permease [Candidatus Delongbacteria bacterium]MBN2833758.1 ABC transporter permease [Candidatus Delongbacteria bacterium]